MTHGTLRRTAPVLLAGTNQYRLRRPSTTGLVPCAPAHTGIAVDRLEQLHPGD